MRSVLVASSLLALPLASQSAATAAVDTVVRPATQRGTFIHGEPFEALRQRIGGFWTARWNVATATPACVIGTGLRLDGWRGDGADEARRHAAEFFTRHGDLFSLRGIELREASCARMGQTWALVYEQFHRGLPVLGGRADIRIHGQGVLSMAGAVALQIAEGFDVVPGIDEGVAFAAAFAQQKSGVSRARQPIVPAPPRLVVWFDPDAGAPASPRLCWEVAISNLDKDGSGAVGRCYVDAKTGLVVRYENDKHACWTPTCARSVRAVGASPCDAAVPIPTTVTVMAWTRTAASAVAAPVNVPMPRLSVTVPGIGIVTTDGNGQFTVDIAAPVTITVANLDGAHHAAIAPALAAPASVFVTPGTSAVLQLFAPSASDTLLAHSNAAHWIDRTNEWARTIFGNTPQLSALDSIAPTVNASSTCNAFYVANTISFYSADPLGACRNSAFSSVIAHEWGHGLDDRHGGITNALGDGLSEGWGDIAAMYLIDSPDIALDFFPTPGSVLRTGNNATRYGTQVEPHLAGESWMGFAWQARQNLRASRGTAEALRVSNSVVLGSIVANARTQLDAVLEVFLADDDDGNLFNGTPHYVELAAAAQGKGLPHPQPQDLVISHSPLGDTTNPHGARGIRAVAFPVATGAVQQVSMVYSRNGEPSVTQTLVRGGVANEWLGLVPGVARGVVRYRILAMHTNGAIVHTPAHGDHVYSVVEPGLAPFSAFVSEDFEGGGVGWSFGVAAVGSGNDWQVDRPQGYGGIAQGTAWTDPPGAFSGRLALGTNLRGGGLNAGRYPSGSDYFARSPVFDCTGKHSVFLRFRRWLSVQQGTADVASVRINGALVWSNPADTAVVDVSWQLVEIPVPMADNNPSVQIEFGITTDQSIEFGGWGIDDLELGERVQAFPTPTLRVLPELMPPSTPVTLTVQTAPHMPFVFVIADGAGPSPLAGLPPVLLSGNQLVQLFAFCDASGAFNWSFPTARAPYGLHFFSQALTLDSNLQPSLTNGCANLILP